ncbi:MAG: hypothetical protein HY901_30690 [Deltaproteobacteria bacterium]|nr:hypothetical protein [Deltaproteobacteria bacterium]
MTATLTPAARAEPAPEKPVTVAILDFISGDARVASERGRTIATLVAARLAKRPGIRIVSVDELRAALSHGHDRALLGEGGPELLPEVTAAFGADFVLHGRVDRFGKRYVLSAALLSASTAQTIARPRVDAQTEDDLPFATDRLGEKLAEALGLPPSEDDPEIVAGHALVGGPSVILNLKFGSTLASLQGFDVDTFSLRFDLEGEVVLRKWLHGYIEIGLLMGRAKSDETNAEGSFSLIPAGSGLKYVFRPDSALQPFIGLGIGMGYFTALLDSNGGVAFRVDGTTGVAWMPWERVGVVAELRAGIDTELTYGFSANFGVAVAF